MLSSKKEKYEFILIRGISAFLCHAVVFIQFNLINFTFDARYLWSVQFYFGLIILLILSIILILVNNTVIIVAIILFRFIVQVLICVPLGNVIEIKIVLLPTFRKSGG